MTRTHTQRPVWVWKCDDCGFEHGFAYSQQDLPSPEEMREQGWFIASLFGDQCPTCVLAGVPRNV